MAAESVTGALVRRLQLTSGLSAEDAHAIRSLPIEVRARGANEVIVHDGARPDQCCLVVDGYCIRTKTTGEGRRQILSIHIEGDIPDLQSLHLNVMDHDLLTLTRCTLGFIGHTPLRNITRQHPRIAEVLWRETLIDAARFREWIVNVGQRPAPSRLVHIAVELRERLRIVRDGIGAQFEMPLTQEQLGEAMGITSIHVNRILKQLRDEGVMELHRGIVTVLDEDRLRDLADFDAVYLHERPAL